MYKRQRPPLRQERLWERVKNPCNSYHIAALEELLRGAAAAGLSAEDQANLAAGSDSVAVQQQAQGSGGDAVVAGAAGAAAYLAHSTRAALRDAARRDDAS